MPRKKEQGILLKDSELAALAGVSDSGFRAFVLALAAYREEGAAVIETAPQEIAPLLSLVLSELERDAEESKRFSELGKRGGQASVNRRLTVGFSPPNGSPKKGFLLLPPTPPNTNIPKNNPSFNPSLFPALSCAREEETDGFSAFWERYPKKFAVAKAREAWARVVVDEDTRQKVMDGLAAWITSDQWTEAGGRYIPKAFVFLEDARYLQSPAGRKDEAKRRAQSFDIDDFFAAALAKSYGESG